MIEKIISEQWCQYLLKRRGKEIALATSKVGFKEVEPMSIVFSITLIKSLSLDHPERLKNPDTVFYNLVIIVNKTIFEIIFNENGVERVKSQ